MNDFPMRLACLMTGFRYAVIKDYDGISRRKVSALAIAMLFPTAIYGFDGYTLVRRVCEGSRGDAIATAIILAIGVFLLERYIILSILSKGLSFFRLLLAIGMSIIGSIGAKSALFDEDIKREIVTMQLEQRDSIKGQVQAAHKGEMKTLTDQEAVYQQRFDNYAHLAEVEIAGTDHSRPGHGRLAKAYEAQRDHMYEDYMKPQLARIAALNQVIEKETATALEQQAMHLGLWTKIMAFFRFAFRTIPGRVLFGILFFIMLSLELMPLAQKASRKLTPFEIDQLDALLMHERARSTHHNIYHHRNPFRP